MQITSGRSKSEQATHCMIPTHSILEKTELRRDGERSAAARVRGSGGRRGGQSPEDFQQGEHAA